MMKIHSEEMAKPGFDDYSLDDVRKMVGFVEPGEDKDGNLVWDVTMASGDGFECKSQELATIMAGIEEIKSKLNIGKMGW